MAVICIDAGTTMIKAVGYDERGHRGRRRPPGDHRSAGRTPAGPSRTWSRSGTRWSTPSAASPTSSASRRGLRRDHRSGRRLLAGRRQRRPDGPGDPVERRAGRRHRRGLDPVRGAGPGVPHQRVADLVGAAQRHPHLAAPVRPGPAGAVRAIADLRWVGVRADDRAVWASTSRTPRRRSWTSAPAGTPRNCCDLYDMEWAQRLLPEIRGDDRRIAELTCGRGDPAGSAGRNAGRAVVLRHRLHRDRCRRGQRRPGLQHPGHHPVHRGRHRRGQPRRRTPPG